MSIEIHPVPFVVISGEILAQLLSIAECLIEVIVGISSETGIIFIGCRDDLPSGGGIKVMVVAHIPFVCSIKMIEHIEGVVGSHTDGVIGLTLLVDKRHYVEVIDTRNKGLLLVVIVIHTHDAVECEISERCIDELYFGVHIILSVFASNRIDERHRVTHDEISILNSTKPIAGVTADEIAVQAVGPVPVPRPRTYHSDKGSAAGNGDRQPTKDWSRWRVPVPDIVLSDRMC